MNDYTVTWTMSHQDTRQRRTFSVTIPAENVERARHAAAGFAWATVTAAEGTWKIANVPEPFTAVEAQPGVLQIVDKDTSDGHHTFGELYQYRLLYNAALFNEWAKLDLYEVHKSRLHHDGTIPFDDPKWFIVVAELPTGQISNHYRVETDWDLFQIPERELPAVYDGHTPAEVATRLEKFLWEDRTDEWPS